MNKVFEDSLANVKVKAHYLTESVRNLILNDSCDNTKSNVVYWIYCLDHLIKYYEEDLFQNSKLQRKISDVAIVPIHLRKAYNSSLCRCNDRKSAILACCNRLERDNK